MALSDDQKAMLRLLAQREQGYDDLAALMGLSVDEVRVRVKEALSQLEEGEAAPSLPAEPEPPAPAAAEPEKREEPAAEPEEPAAEPPRPEEPVAVEPVAAATSPPSRAADPPKPAAAAGRRRASSPPRLAMPKGQGARAAIAAGIAVVALVIVVLLISGGSGSGSDASTGAAPAETTSAGQTTAASSKGKPVTQAILSAVDGSGASGSAVFGRVKNSLALQVQAEGLAPTKKGQAYTIWLAQSPQKMLPLASSMVPRSGKIAAQFEVPTEVLAYLANETFGQIVVTQTSNSLLKAALTKATQEKKAPVYTGSEVLSGPITGPIVGAAKKAKKK